MSEVTIDIPAEHVADVRHQIQWLITGNAEDLNRYESWSGGLEVSRAAVANITALGAALDCVGWEADACSERRVLTLDSELLAEALETGREYAKDDVGRAEADELNALMARIKWLSETLDSLEPEAVPA